MNAISAARLEELYPRLKTAGQQLCQLLALKGIDVEISQGLRTWPQQATIYAQGRTTPGPIVTHAKPGESFHQYGLAFDIDIVTLSGLDWTGNDSAWQAAIAAGESLGLFSGSEWHGAQMDRPHFQLTGPYGETPDDEIKSTFAAVGLQGVWDELDKYYAGVQA